MKTRFRCEIIELYNGGLTAAVRFEGKGRVECINREQSNIDFKIGFKGIASYNRVINGYLWFFEGFKNNEPDAKN